MTEAMGDPGNVQALHALLQWYRTEGICDVVGSTPTIWTEQKYPVPGQGEVNEAAAGFATETGLEASPFSGSTSPFDPPDTPRKSSRKSPAPVARIEPSGLLPADEAIAEAMAIAATASSIEALAQAVASFDHCPLKKSARSTVFIDGTETGPLLVIGEAPGRDEDRIGKPFVGRAGQLLDKMLAAIGYGRSDNTLISNVIFWRPPGNRTPTQTEIAICRPFVDRLIDLHDPKAILLAGGAPMQALLGITGIMRSRGKWQEVKTASGKTVPALPIFHPAFLLRQPQQKRLAWQDLKSMAAHLRES
ncbi:MAG: uracil-DNA glycosylase [Pseudomonadota bacterium]